MGLSISCQHAVEDGTDEYVEFCLDNPTQSSFDDFVIRLKNTYIEAIKIDFDNDLHRTPFLRRWPGLSPGQCRVQTLVARCYSSSADRHLLNAAVQVLTPHTLQVNGDTVRAMNIFQAELVPVFVRHLKVIGTYQQVSRQTCWAELTQH